MKQLAFRTVIGSAYVVNFGDAGGINVVRISDHPVAGRTGSDSFDEPFDGLTGQVRYEIEVLVEVKDDQHRELRRRGDPQVQDGWRTMSPPTG